MIWQWVGEARRKEQLAIYGEWKRKGKYILKHYRE
jgi:hypothetical protein